MKLSKNDTSSYSDGVHKSKGTSQTIFNNINNPNFSSESDEDIFLQTQVYPKQKMKLNFKSEPSNVSVVLESSDDDFDDKSIKQKMQFIKRRDLQSILDDSFSDLPAISISPKAAVTRKKRMSIADIIMPFNINDSEDLARKHKLSAATSSTTKNKRKSILEHPTDNKKEIKNQRSDISPSISSRRVSQAGIPVKVSNSLSPVAEQLKSPSSGAKTVLPMSPFRYRTPLRTSLRTSVLRGLQKKPLSEPRPCIMDTDSSNNTGKQQQAMVNNNNNNSTRETEEHTTSEDDCESYSLIAKKQEEISKLGNSCDNISNNSSIGLCNSNNIGLGQRNSNNSIGLYDNNTSNSLSLTALLGTPTKKLRLTPSPHSSSLDSSQDELPDTLPVKTDLLSSE